MMGQIIKTIITQSEHMIDLERVEMANPIDKYIINEQGRISLEGAKKKGDEEHIQNWVSDG